MELISPRKVLAVYEAVSTCATAAEIAEKVELDAETVSEILDVLRELRIIASTPSGLLCSYDGVRHLQEQLRKVEK